LAGEPLTLHFLEPGDSSSQNFSGTFNSVARIKPVINPNRGASDRAGGCFLDLAWQAV
jgi:hypothetical protein